MPVDPVPASPGLMASLSGWKATAVALAAAAALSFPALDAHALVLGRLNVLSALGEPLQAEIDVPQLSNEEADSLRTELASPEAFRAAGLEYNSALIGMQLTLQRRPGGRAVIRVTSNRPVNDPFVDLILQLTWSSGRVVRDYTVLLDPPAMRQNNPAANAANNTPAQVPAPATTSAPTPAAVPAPRPAPAPSIQATAPAAPRAIEAPRPPAPAPRPAPAPTPAPARAQPPAAAPVAPATATTGEPSGKQVTVKPGDTASRIAAANKPASVSLDQMLVALLRSNPDAFVQNNVNRMKAGSVLEVPSASQAAATPPAEASQIITAQARDFDSFRRALAGNAPSVRTAEASRSASGRVQTQVDERKPSTTAPDKLTLSKGGIQGQVSEEQIAREKAARDAADRVAELSKNISELNKLGAASTATTAATPAASAPAPAPAPTPTASAPAGADVPAATASAPAEASTSAATGTTPAVTASAPEAPAPAPVASAPAAPTVAAAPAPAPAEESSWLDTLTENPMLPAAGAGLLALLAALGIYRSRERKKAAQLDSSFLESKMSGDSFFGSSGGQQVDTSAEEGEGPASSLSYSPSQLDAAGDVDPVAEADVYLAYGRDLQAEEILREALRNNPERIAIHAKLLDIYAKRRDVTSYAAQALVARDLTQREGSGQGHEWTRIAEIGRQLDPANPLYRPESNASGAASDATAHIPLSFPVPTEAAPLAAGSLQADAQPNTAASLDSDSNALDFDLDLALDLDLDKNSQAAALAAEEPEPVISLDLGEPRVEPTIDIPLLPEDKPSAASDEVAPTVLAFGDDDLLATPPTPAPGLPEVDFDLGEPDDVPVPTPAPATPAQPVPPAPDYNNAALTVPAALEPASPAPEASPLDFDLNLDIDLSPASDVPPPAPSADLDDDELPELDAAQQRPVQDSDMIEFDLGSLSLDLGDSTPTGAPAAPASAASAAETKPASAPTAATPAATEPAAAEEELDINDPLATKLALAEEFHSIGDEDGAKALAEEVLEEATGSLRAKAERFLAGMA